MIIHFYYDFISSNKHYQTSSKYSGMDLSLARKVFKKLAKKEKVLAEVFWEKLYLICLMVIQVSL